MPLSRCPKFHELDRISGNKKTVRVINGAASRWDEIATRLFFDGNTILQIWKDSQNNTLWACWRVFTKWLEGKEGLRTPRTWDTVIIALKEADFGQLADDLGEALRGRRQIEASVMFNCTCIVLPW